LHRCGLGLTTRWFACCRLQPLDLRNDFPEELAWCTCPESSSSRDLLLFGSYFGRPGDSSVTRSRKSNRVSQRPRKKGSSQDDSFVFVPAKDLALQPENNRKASALVDFVEGSRLEENAEIENALAAYQKVLNFDPGQADLALHVAALLSRQEDFPRAIDVLKDAIKANPKELAPYLQLSFLYGKYLKKADQAAKYANQLLHSIPRILMGISGSTKLNWLLGIHNDQ
jgi:tetratricopeptide (TPR) repeat protein